MTHDKEKLGKIFADIERYFSDLETLNINNVNQLKIKKNFYSVSMLLFAIINRTINLGEEIITANNIGTPSTYKDIFFLLMKGKVINRQMKNRLSELSYYRNLFSHEYHAFESDDVFKALQKINIVKEFVKRIKTKIN